MKKVLKQSAICATICALFVLAVLAQRPLGLLGPETAGVALVTAAVLPPGPGGVLVQNGPIWPPDPVDLPGLNAKNGPIWPPDPVDLPKR
jgi:hypothetical protein